MLGLGNYFIGYQLASGGIATSRLLRWIYDGITSVQFVYGALASLIYGVLEFINSASESVRMRLWRSLKKMLLVMTPTGFKLYHVKGWLFSSLLHPPHHSYHPLGLPGLSPDALDLILGDKAWQTSFRPFIGRPFHPVPNSQVRVPERPEALLS